MSDLIPWLAPWSGRVAVAVAVVIGIALAGWAMWPRRGGAVCRRCGYPRAGLGPGAVCPECGSAAAAVRRRPQPRFARTCAVLGLTLALGTPGFVAGRRIHRYGWDYYLRLQPLYSLWPRKTVQRQRFGSVVATKTIDRRDEFIGEPWQLHLRAGDTTLVDLEEHAVHVGPAFVDTWDSPPSTSHPGADLNADGTPEIQVVTFSGGAHCCTRYIFLDVAADPARVLLELGPSNAHPEAVDLDADGVPEIEYFDDTFAYWNTCYTCSPMPRVVFAYDPVTRTLRPSDGFMRAPIPDGLDAEAGELQKKIAAATGDQWCWENPELWGTMLDLIYSGHADEAARFLDAAWPPEREGRESFLADFLDQLRTSPYADALAELNGGSLWPEP